MNRALPNGCGRCGEKTVLTFGSYFDESFICSRCNQIERAHPDFERARDTEVREVQAGNYNYPGIGLPAGLQEACQAARAAAQEAR